MGFMLQQAIRNRLESIGIGGEVAAVLTEVEVDPNDPAFKRPTKPIGPFFTRYRAEALERDLGWTMREDSGRGWRHVVPSPRPLRILNMKTISRMIGEASVVIAAGGGGIPVVRGRDGQWRDEHYALLRAGEHCSCASSSRLRGRAFRGTGGQGTRLCGAVSTIRLTSVFRRLLERAGTVS